MSAYNIGWIWDQKVTATQKLVLFALNEHTNMSHGDWRIWPSLHGIVRLTGLSESTVRRSITELSELGIITVCSQHDPKTGRQLSNLYYLNAPFPGGEGVTMTGGRVSPRQGEGVTMTPLEPSYMNTSLPNGKESARRFLPPAVSAVSEYARSIGSDIDPDQFCDFYGSKGWKVGAAPMKDWKAAVRNWSRRDANGTGRKGRAAPEAYV